MMKRSFAEIDSVQDEDKRTIQLEDLNKQFASVGELECSKCAHNIDGYYEKCSQITHLHNELQVS